MNQEEALSWLADLFNEPKGKIQPEDSRDTIGGWDSMAVLLLMADLDEKFGIQLEEKEMTSIATVRDILDLLQRHGKLA